MGTVMAENELPQAWLLLPEVVEVLAPGGKYTVGRAALRKEHGVVLVNAKKIETINSAEEAEQATNFGRLLQAATAAATEFYKGFKKQIDAIKAPVLNDEHEDVDAYEAEKKRLGTLQTAWNRKVREEQEAAERKAREDALAKAQEEKLQRAIEVESIEGTEAAEQILNEPLAPLPSVPLMRSYAKPTGSVSKFTYSAKVLNVMELVKAVAAGNAPLQALQVDQAWLNSKARLDKEAYSVPGTELVKTEGTHYRS
jgi:hypothetical protein